jgi:hypothetical protein
MQNNGPERRFRIPDRVRTALQFGSSFAVGLGGALVLGSNPEQLNNVVEATRHIPISLGRLLEITRGLGIADQIVGVALLGMGSFGLLRPALDEAVNRLRNRNQSDN